MSSPPPSPRGGAVNRETKYIIRNKFNPDHDDLVSSAKFNVPERGDLMQFRSKKQIPKDNKDDVDNDDIETGTVRDSDLGDYSLYCCGLNCSCSKTCIKYYLICVEERHVSESLLQSSLPVAVAYIPADFRALSIAGRLVFFLVTIIAVTFTIISFSHFVDADEFSSVYNTVNYRNQGDNEWRIALKCLSGPCVIFGALTILYQSASRPSRHIWGLIFSILYVPYSYAVGYIANTQIALLFMTPAMCYALYTMTGDDPYKMDKRPPYSTMNLFAWPIVLLLLAAVAIFLFYESRELGIVIEGERPHYLQDYTTLRILDAISGSIAAVVSILILLHYVESIAFMALLGITEFVMYSSMGAKDIAVAFNMEFLWAMLIFASGYAMYEQVLKRRKSRRKSNEDSDSGSEDYHNEGIHEGPDEQFDAKDDLNRSTYFITDEDEAEFTFSREVSLVKTTKSSLPSSPERISDASATINDFGDIYGLNERFSQENIFKVKGVLKKGIPGSVPQRMKLDDDKKLHNDVIDERLSFTTEGGSTVTKRTTLTTGLAFDISNSRDPHAYNNGRNGFLPTFAEDPDPNLSLDIAIQRPKPTSFAGSVRFVEVGETSDSRNVPPIGKLNESYSALGQVHVAEESKWTFGLPDVSSMVPVDFGIEKSLSSFSNMMASRATEPRRGVMVGKFWPLHKGHEYLLGKALCHCDELYIIVKVKPYELPRGRLRAGWVRAASPHAHVMIIEDVYDPEDAYLWAALLKEWCGFVPRVLFGSEKARAVACALGSECNHVMIDDMREVHPIAGLTIRSNPVASWEHLPPNVRGYYAERVVIVGAPCTGKSTVAQELAAHFDAPLVNDYAKELAEQNLVAQRKVGKHGTSFNWTDDDVRLIIEKQCQREAEAGQVAKHGVIVCDSNAFSTLTWYQQYFNKKAPHSLRKLQELLMVPPAIYIYFDTDGTENLRSHLGPDKMRDKMNRMFTKGLSNQKNLVPTVQVKGAVETRLEACIVAVEGVLNDLHRFPVVKRSRSDELSSPKYFPEDEL